MAAGSVARVGQELWNGLWGKLESNVITRGTLESGEAGLRRIGPLGETLSDMLKLGKENIGRRVGNVSSYYIPRAEEAMKSGLSEEIVNDLERRARASHPQALELADYARIMREAVYQEAQQIGIKVGPRVADDFPHMWDPKIFEGTGREDVINHLLKSGQATSRHDAEHVIDQIMSVKGRVHTLESPRLIQLPNYRRDLSVPFDHLNASIRRIEFAKIFGPKNEKLNLLLDEIAKQHGPAAYKYADLVATSVMGNSGLASDFDMYANRSWLRKTASIEALMHLSLAVLRHSGQFANTTVVTGLKPSIRALARMMSDFKGAEDFALTTGALVNKTVHDFRRLANVETETLGGKLLRYSGFDFVDKLRRVFASNSAAEFVDQQASRLAKDPNNAKAIRNLRLMGIDPDEIKRGVNSLHYLQAGRRLSDLTQFESDALSLPPRWLAKDEPILQLAMMYKQFFFHQARFVKDMVLKPVFLEGDMKPLLYMATLFPTFGEMVADVNEFARKGDLKNRPQHVVERMIDNYASIGGFGIWHDLVYAFAQPQKEAAMRFVIGPAISDLIDIGTIPGQRHPIEEIEKRLVRAIPVIGPVAQKKAFPPKKQPTKGPLQRGAITKELNKVFGLELP